MSLGKSVGSFGASGMEKIGSAGKYSVDKISDGVGIVSLGKHMNKMIVGGNKENDGIMGEIGDLIKIVESHVNYMVEQEKNINKIISSSNASQQQILQNAKKAAKKTEQELIQEITNISGMNAFLNNIILIENLFNSIYTSQQQLYQSNARKKYATKIEIYEKKPKKKSDYKSFIELIFSAKTDLKEFKNLIKNVENECNKQNIKIISNSGAKEKNIERAFYKSYYVYGVKNGHRYMTDMLRCSLVFDSFDNLYQCFGIIEILTKCNGGNGILRCKDRFEPKNVEFGYRDLLINIQCPQSKIICEIQLHHLLFYKHKKISHQMYKKARLFEQNDVNFAYGYADNYIRDSVGGEIYKYDKDENNEEKKEEQTLNPYQLLKDWGLTQYIKVLIEEQGYEEIQDWKILTLDELKQMGFKPGHSRMFIRKLKELS